MHLNIIHAAIIDNMLHHLCGNIARPHLTHLQAHRKQTIRKAAKRFSVEEIPPTSQHLPKRKAGCNRIRQQPEIDPFPFAIDDCRQHAADDAAVNGKSALSEGKYLFGMRAVKIPRKNNIIQPCPDNGKNQRIDDKIDVHIRGLPRPLCLLHCHQHPQNHRQPDKNAVPVDVPSEYRKRHTV